MKHNTTAGKVWLSVIIPIYNAEKYLVPCLDSIRKQTYANYEVLLIDDGSTDSSPDICKKYVTADSRFRYIKKENGGSYQARILGAENAHGKYVTFCDADDYYLTNKAFERIYEELKNDKYRTLQFLNVKKYNHLKKRSSSLKAAISIDHTGFLSQEYPKLLCSFWDAAHLTIAVWDKVYHRSLLFNLPRSDSVARIFWGDDLITNLHLLSTCDSFRFIPDDLYCYRQFSGGTKRFSGTAMRDLDHIKMYQLQFLEQYQGGNKEIMRSILFSEIAGWFSVYVREALVCIGEAETKKLISEALQLPRFVLARNYYLSNRQDKSPGSDLLRRADAEEYIARAKEEISTQSIKNSIKKLLKKIYMSI